MSSLHSIMPLFVVADLKRSLRFYRDVLGFEVRTCVPEDEPFFAIVRHGSVGLMLKHVGPDVPATPNRQQHEWARWDAFISAVDPDAYAAECSGRADGQAFDVQDTDDELRGFEAVDPDGYVLFIGRPVNSADSSS